MRTKKNGDAIGLLCGAEGCNAVYADVFSDRVLVYSFHYRRPHSTPIHADQFVEIGRHVYNRTPASMECVCGQLTCVMVTDGQVILESQHRVETATGKVREVHRNIWRLEEIEQIVTWLGLISDTIPDVEFDLAEVRQAS